MLFRLYILFLEIRLQSYESLKISLKSYLVFRCYSLESYNYNYKIKIIDVSYDLNKFF